MRELELENGMRFLLVERPDAATVAAGWAARVGSASEAPGRTGLAHLLEHLMFKGSRVVGGRAIEREEPVLAEIDRVAGDIRRAREREGSSSRGRTGRRIAALEAELEELQREARSLALLGEFSLLYQRAGATGLNANTLQDLTLYYVTLPADRLELWFWLESDRLLQPVFREFHLEKRVLSEERRMRIESTPTGRLDEELARSFWGDDPYGRPTSGLPQDLDRLTREDARRFFERHYRPRELTAVLVGPFDSEQIEALARTYFGRLPQRPEPPDEADAATGGRPQRITLSGECDCPPQARVLYPAVPFEHADAPALDLLAALLNGRSGRLHRRLVIERGLAFSAWAIHGPLRRGGYFSLQAEGKGEGDPKELLRALDGEIEALRRRPISPEELARVKNRLAADSFRRLKEPISLVQQLLIYDALGDWRHLNRWTERILRVPAGELSRVANHYLDDSRRQVALYHRRPTGDGGRAGAS